MRQLEDEVIQLSLQHSQFGYSIVQSEREENSNWSGSPASQTQHESCVSQAGPSLSRHIRNSALQSYLVIKPCHLSLACLVGHSSPEHVSLPVPGTAWKRPPCFQCCIQAWKCYPHTESAGLGVLLSYFAGWLTCNSHHRSSIIGEAEPKDNSFCLFLQNLYSFCIQLLSHSP